MPWTEKQLRLFRAAAHNPEIAKRTGIKQSDAERMSKEGLKKMASGGKALINKQDTRHGKVDMPFAKLGRFAGMKKGGFMKKRRFDKGGDIERLGADQSFGDAFKEARGSGASTFTWRGKKYTTEMAKPSAPKAPAKQIIDYGDEGGRLRSKFGEDLRSAAEQKKPTVIKRADTRGFSDALANKIGAEAQAEREKYSGFRKGGAIMRSKKNIGKDQMGMAPYKKGGEMESKAMVGKEVAFMKKKGAPASMIKHEAAEMKGMKKGGACYARGGGIESRGKTKGTMIRMASGGSVSSASRRADGIAQRGKTRC